jgi:hypothetical protein
MRVLVVTNPFRGHQKGQVITDPALVSEILSGAYAHNVIKSDHPGTSAPTDGHPEDDANAE